jgi:hypothetical protein
LALSSEPALRDKNLNSIQQLKKETYMSKMQQRPTATRAVIATLVLATAALAQMPTSPWKKGAPFPEPDEEPSSKNRKRVECGHAFQSLQVTFPAPLWV